jgi:hypothetical protein
MFDLNVFHRIDEENKMMLVEKEKKKKMRDGLE